MIADDGTAPALVRDVLLLDGSTMRLRAPRPEDLEDVRAFYDAMSPESRYLRFHGYARTDRAARDLVQAAGVDRLALIGHQGGRIVATAQYDGLREPGVAEVAFAVAEEFRNRGAATRLLEQLADLAAERGIHRFDAYVLPGNRPMLAVFERAGYGVRSHGAGGEITVSLDITPSPAVRRRIDERDHIGAVASLRPILAPASIAIADGGEERPDGTAGRDGRTDIGAVVVASIQEAGYHGRIVELDDHPDLVVIAVPAQQVADVARRSAQSGARALLVLSTSDRADRARGEELLEIVRGGGLRLIGPNSLGVMNTAPEVSLDATIAGAPVMPGRLAICSHSGAIGVGLLGHAAARSLGISSFVSLGDRLDVSTNDVLEFWEEDLRTAAVMLYVETFGNPQRFARIAQRVSRRKPILAVKGRRAAEIARQEAGSHTAAALCGDTVVDALFQQAGVLRFRSGDELFSAAQFFASQPLPNGRRVAILSNSDGVATLAADACATRGLLVSAPGGGGAATVVQEGTAGAEADHYAAHLNALLLDEHVDAVMVYYVERYGGDPPAVLRAVSDAAAESAKPVVASIVGVDGRLPPGGDGTGVAAVPNFVFPETCATVLARAAQRREWLSRPLGEPGRFDDLDQRSAEGLISAALESREPGDAVWLTLSDDEELLETHGIHVARSRTCTHIEQAIAASREIGGPVALKAAFEPPAHAADLDAVLLGLEGEAAVVAGWEQLKRRVRTAGRAWMGALVQPLAAPGADVLVGAVSDPDLGPVMAVGPGGRDAPLTATVAFRLLPTTDVEAEELIAASAGVAARLAGFRGADPLDRDALRELVLRFAALLGRCPGIVEADLNPVRLMPRGYLVLDARMRVERRRPPARVKTW